MNFAYSNDILLIFNILEVIMYSRVIMKIKNVILLLCISLLFSCTTKIDSQWRGPDRNGVFPETGLLQQWPEKGPELIWRFDSLQMGHSSPAITEGAIYVTGMPDSITGYLFCLSHDGELLWKEPYGEEYKTFYTGSRSTPTVVGEMLYMLTGGGDVICFNLKERNKVWTRSYVKDFMGELPTYGFAESLVVDGNKLFCTVGNEEYNVVCLDRFTGELIWSCEGNKELAKSSSPILVNHNGNKLLVAITVQSVMGIDPDKGMLKWKIPFEPVIFHFVNTPLYHDGVIYMAGTANKSDTTKGGFMAIELNEDGSDANVLWQRNLSNLMSGYMVIDNNLYTSTYRKNEWFCLDALTGETKYTWDGYDYGTISYADKRFYVLSTDGNVLLCEAKENEFKTISNFKLDIKLWYPFALLWAPPVIKNKKLYIRHKGSLFVYNIAEEKAS